MVKIKVKDLSHDYSMHLRFQLVNNSVIGGYWFDIVDNTELDNIKRCDGKHNSLNSLFSCDSCRVLFGGGYEQ